MISRAGCIVATWYGVNDLLALPVEQEYRAGTLGSPYKKGFGRNGDLLNVRICLPLTIIVKTEKNVFGIVLNHPPPPLCDEML